MAEQRAEVDWLLVGCTLDEVRSTADRRGTLTYARGVRVVVTGERLTARRIPLSRFDNPQTLRATVSGEPDGVRVQGVIHSRADDVYLVIWLVITVALAVAAVAALVADGPTAGRFVVPFLAAVAFAAVAVGFIRERRPTRQREETELFRALVERFTPPLPTAEETRIWRGRKALRRAERRATRRARRQS